MLRGASPPQPVVLHKQPTQQLQLLWMATHIAGNPKPHARAALQLIYEETKGEAIISTGVGQHQMWAAQWYNYDAPRRWVSSGGLGSMGFGLPSAIGAAVAFDGTDGREKRVSSG